MLVLAARAAKIDVIDSVYSDVNNDEGFIAETIRIKEMGFDGKSVINPRQIKLVNQVFTPTIKEIEKAQRVVEAFEESLARKSGVVSLNGKMIDAPVVTRAQRILAYANAVGACRKGESL
ncbi:Citrate lyase subunit beta [bioreactor metagenome]|uniref:Citrate lyase subunit beta n=1 Tax=bioreactor metagenome TaxID=1076179 RepID=A0A645J7F6_9ZZZZ